MLILLFHDTTNDINMVHRQMHTWVAVPWVRGADSQSEPLTEGVEPLRLSLGYLPGQPVV